MVYHTEKIISIGGKYYSAVELLEDVVTGETSLVVREMTLNKKEYRHPVTDQVTTKKVYNLMPRGSKALVSVDCWEESPDLNLDGLKIDHSLGH